VGLDMKATDVPYTEYNIVVGKAEWAGDEKAQILLTFFC
jgi:hypothetical protein